MAGIEKICEYSGEYVGHNMYHMKRNQLQIHRDYRKLFRGAVHTLIIHFEEWYFQNNWCRTAYTEDVHLFFGKGRKVAEYRFELVVSDPALQGEVDGVYLNWTTHLPTMKRKLKRLLRCRKLNIKQR